LAWQVSSDTEFELLENGKGHTPAKIRCPPLQWSSSEIGIVSIKDGGVTNQYEAVIIGPRSNTKSYADCIVGSLSS